ncbi:Galactose oxidase, beta-propeller [Corchorus capsularis]|uniref:Galactose oxidase, beta-propeller n=1 Tax=Corchorus capsularis TaxID=210143 RepID=A0A1R3I203_COCAP|nr:Galactose oxidase, beta-propeller [Corchorus capsularis]
MEAASDAKRQKTENMEEASDAKRKKLENLVTLEELEATSNQNQTEGETGIIKFTPVRRGKIEDMNFFLRNCPSSRQPWSQELTATSTKMCQKRSAGLTQFSPICRGYIILWSSAQCYAIQFCTSKDNFKHPLGNIKEIDSRFMNLKALPVTHMSYSVADCEGNHFSCFSKKATVNGDKDSLACVPPMQREKVGPLSVVLDGKLYVMGSCYIWDESKEPWGEIFDPSTMQWRMNEYLYAYDLRNRLFCRATPAEMGLIGEGYDDWFKERRIHDLGNNNLCLVLMLDDCNSVRVVVFEPYVRINGHGAPYLDVILKGHKDYRPGVTMEATYEMILKQES